MLDRQVVRYIIVGVTGTVTHLALLAFCVEIFRLNPLYGVVVGFAGALSVSFIMNHYWTFKSRRARLSSLWRYITVSCSGLLLNTTLIYFLIYHLEFGYFVAQSSAITIIPVSNYLLNRYWTFASR